MNDRCGISRGFPDVPKYPESSAAIQQTVKYTLKLKRGWEKYRGGRQGGAALRCAALRSGRRGFTLTVMAVGTLTDWSAVRRMSGTAL